MKLARAVHLDTSNFQVFAAPAKTDEWCVAGGCVFADWRPADLTGKARQAFANGWLGLESFGHATLVAVARVEARRDAALTESPAPMSSLTMAPPTDEARCRRLKPNWPSWQSYLPATQMTLCFQCSAN